MLSELYDPRVSSCALRKTWSMSIAVNGENRVCKLYKVCRSEMLGWASTAPLGCTQVRLPLPDIQIRGNVVTTQPSVSQQWGRDRGLPNIICWKYFWYSSDCLDWNLFGLISWARSRRQAGLMYIKKISRFIGGAKTDKLQQYLSVMAHENCALLKESKRAHCVFKAHSRALHLPCSRSYLTTSNTWLRVRPIQILCP